MNKNFDYKKSGVDLEKSDEIKSKLIEIVRSTHRDEVINNKDGYGGLFSIRTFKKDSVLVSTTDSVGTKVKISSRINLHRNLGIDIVNHCVNDLIPQGAFPLYFLDYLAFGELNEEVVMDIIEGIADACKKVNCSIIGGETATLPGVYGKKDYDVVGFMVGIVDPKKLIKPDNVKEGDILIALPSSGLHTTGFSLVRAIFDLDNDINILSRKINGEESNFGELLSAPHRDYLSSIKNLFHLISGISHITGGGLYKNLPRIFIGNLKAEIKKDSWEIPEIFKFIMEKGNVSIDEMFNVYNMGVGLVIITDPSNVKKILSECPDSWIVGEMLINDDKGSSVVIK
jgi:phosphoribosylformylglycinamidine cyclo-ligase